MRKLPNIFGGSEITLTQAPHGKSQNYKAIDVAPGPLYAPFDGCKTSKTYSSGQQSYFNLTLPDGSYLQCVHGVPVKENHEFKEGEVVGNTVPYSKGDHWHIAINVIDKGWDVILNYLDQSSTIKLIPGFSSRHWSYWSTWEDLYLNIKSKKMEEKYKPSLDYGHDEVQKAIEMNNKDRDPVFSNTSEENMQRLMDNKMFLVMYYRILDNIERYVDDNLTHSDIATKLNPEKLARSLKKYLKEDVEVENVREALLNILGAE